jgi:hypothetical protein
MKLPDLNQFSSFHMTVILEAGQSKNKIIFQLVLFFFKSILVALLDFCFAEITVLTFFHFVLYACSSRCFTENNNSIIPKANNNNNMQA